LVDEPSIRPSMHIFVGSKAPWFEITDGLPQFDELPSDG
ncbi:MAG: GFA family protein, partial [Janthinobacterium lividum]